MTKYPLVPGTSAEFEKTVARLVEAEPIMSNKIPGSYVTMPGVALPTSSGSQGSPSVTSNKHDGNKLAASYVCGTAYDEYFRLALQDTLMSRPMPAAASSRPPVLHKVHKALRSRYSPKTKKSFNGALLAAD